MTEYELDKICEGQDCNCDCMRCQIFGKYIASQEEFGFAPEKDFVTKDISSQDD